jgi:general secretion pathway protein G
MKTWPRRDQGGFTLIELIVSVAILSILCGMAMPVARYEVKREREHELRNVLRELRDAIDRYADGSLSGKFNNAPSYGYPPNLDALVTPIELRNGTKLKIMREIPIDPMTGNRDWGIHSMEDDPGSDSWDGNQVWDIYSKAEGTGLDGTKYRDW